VSTQRHSNCFKPLATLALLTALVCATLPKVHGVEPTALYIATDGNDTWSGQLA
jgi:hypothetical protein